MNKEDELTNVSFRSINDKLTKVSVAHDGFKKDDVWTEAINWHEKAWSGVLSSLKSALEKGEGNLCVVSLYSWENIKEISYLTTVIYSRQVA